MKKTIFLILVLLISQNLLSQTSQKFRKNFTTNSGVYGYVMITTQPTTVGSAYIWIQQDRVVIEGIRTSDHSFNSNELSDFGVSFPMDCRGCYFSAYGRASMLIPGSSTRDHASFNQGGSIHLGGMGKTNQSVNFSQNAKDRHNKARKDGSGSAWENTGRVESLNITTVQGSDIGKVTSAVRSFERAQEEEKKRKEEELKKKKEEEERKEREEKERLEKEKEKEEDDEDDEDDEEENSNSNNRPNSTSIGNSSGETSSTEQLKKEQADKERQQYNEMVRRNNDRNEQLAASSAGASIGFLYLLGEVIYSNMGYSPSWEPYNDNMFYMCLDYGYSFSSSPILFNSTITTLEYNSKTYSNDLVTNYDVDPLAVSTINFDFDYVLGLENDYALAEVGYKVKAGSSLIFTGFHLGGTLEGKLAAGIKNIKFMYNFRWGNRQFFKNDWIDSEEFGYGKAKYNYKGRTIGLRGTFTGYDTRHHISFGFVRERFAAQPDSDYDAGTFKAKFDSQTSSLFSRNYFKGYHFEWEKENFFVLYCNLMPNYSMNGYIGDEHLAEYTNVKTNSGLFIEMGFIRQIKIGGFNFY